MVERDQGFQNPKRGGRDDEHVAIAYDVDAELE
jgi:hypothetical protein